MQYIHYAQDWKHARTVLEELSGELPLHFGVGNYIDSAYAQAVYLDADAGEGQGYRLAIRPTGNGLNCPTKYHLIYLAGTVNHIMCREKVLIWPLTYKLRVVS